MAVSSRVRQDQGSEVCEAHGQFWVYKLANGSWGIWNDASNYTQGTGFCSVFGKTVYRMDPVATIEEQGKPARFTSKEAAIAYIEKWLKQGRSA